MARALKNLTSRLGYGDLCTYCLSTSKIYEELVDDYMLVLVIQARLNSGMP